MSTEKQALRTPPKGLAKYEPFDSTNGIFNIILLVLFALGAWVGIPEETVNDLFVAAVPVVMGIREIIQKIKDSTPRWNGNTVTYVLAALAAAFPIWGDAISSLKPLIEQFTAGEFSWIKLLPLLIPILNQIAVAYKTSKENKSITDTVDNSAL